MRFAKLVGILNQTLEPPARKKVFGTLGRERARAVSRPDRQTRERQGFPGTGQDEWVETVEYDEQAGTIRIVDKSPNCTCPLVKQGVTPPEFCDCTLGWQKEA